MKPDFPTAYAVTMKHEIGVAAGTRGYSVDQDDPGGETVSGISRVHHPNWMGWKIVDRQKALPGFPGNLSQVAELDGFIAEFYRENYWNFLRCGEMPEHAIAAELFDTGINTGTNRAALFLQQALNLLNRNGKLYQDIDEDGDIGAQTITVLRVLLQTDSASRLLTVMNVLQGSHYINLMRHSPVQEKYVGWFDRVTLTRN